MRSNKNVTRMIRYFFRCKKATIYACVMMLLGLVVGIVTPVCNKLIQDDIIPNKNISLFIWLTIVILILNIVSTLSSFMNTRIFIENGVPITSNIRKDIIKMNTFSKKNDGNRGKVLISSTNFLEEANSFYISYMYLIFDCILKFMFYLPFFLLYGKQLAFVMIVTVIISFAVLEILKIFARKTIEISNRVSSERYDYTLKLYKMLHKENFEEDDIYNINTYMDKVHACDKAWINYCMFANLYGYSFNFIWFIGVAVCLCLTLGMINSGAIIISTFIVFNSYLEQLKIPIGNFVTFKKITDRFDESFGNVFDMLDDEDLLNLKKLQD